MNSHLFKASSFAFVVMVLLLSLMTSSTHATTTWDIQTVDTTVGHGVHTSMALDSSGNPHIAYYDAASGLVKYAYWDGSVWNIQIIDSTGSVGGERNPSLALDSSGYPHVAYYAGWWVGLRYASWDGSVWHIQNVYTTLTGGNPSLALDSRDQPHIFFNGIDYVYYVSWDQSTLTWDYRIVAPTQCTAAQSLALDANDNPHMSYDDWRGNLGYSSWTGSGWSYKVVDTSGTIGGFTGLYITCLAFDHSGNPHISYCDSTDALVKYAYWDGSVWNIQTVDSIGNNGGCTSLALDSSGNPHISYYDTTNSVLKYASWDGSSWNIQTVATSGNGWMNSLALDSEGSPHVCYFDANNHLMYARTRAMTCAITFSQQGVGLDFIGTALVVDGTQYGTNTLPVTFYWPVGSVHTFTFQSPLIAQANAEQYVWTGTTGLSSMQSGSINVTTDGSIVGNYKTQYYLTVQTNPLGVDSPTGEGWYDDGTYGSISTSLYVDIVSGFSRYNFTGWTTTGILEITNPSMPSTTVLMDKAKNLTAKYVIQYNITYYQTGVGSDLTDALVVIDGSDYNISALPTSFWYDNGSTHSFAYESPLVIPPGAKQYDWNSTIGLSTLQSDSITITNAGSLTGNYVTRVHDVAVTSVVAVVPHCSSKVGSDLWVFQGRPVYANVMVLNKGYFDENVTVTLYYNITASQIVGAQNVTLSPGQNETVAFVWDTTGVPDCLNYTLTAVATIPLDINPVDNTQACGPINVRIMGDINGDGKVDGKDIALVALSFGSCGPDYLHPGSPPYPRWNLDCDTNGDNKIDGKDLTLTALHFGQAGP